MKKRYVVLMIALALASGCQDGPVKDNQAKTEMTDSAQEVAYYTCPMHPQVHKDKPGKCPICGMTLVPVMKTEMQMNDTGKSMPGMKMDSQIHDSSMKGIDMAGTQMKDSGNSMMGMNMKSTEDDALVQLPPRKQFLAGIRVVGLGGTEGGREITLTGRTIPDPTQTSAISAWIGGWIQQTYVRNPGERIRRGQRLYDLYSPDLLAAENDYRLALQQKDLFEKSSAGVAKTIDALQQKMLRWGLSQPEIKELISAKPTGKITIYSKQSGILAQRLKTEGDFVREGETVFELANNDNLWVQAQLYDTELGLLSGQPEIWVQLENFTRPLKGKIAFNNPVNRSNSRVYPLYISVSNPGGQIQSGMLADVHLKQRPSFQSTLTVPASAVVYDKGMTYVWLALPENKFKRQMVGLGQSNDNGFAVKSGLNPGDRVVVGGTYLVNSEYRLRTGGMNMAGMQMSDMQMSGKGK